MEEKLKDLISNPRPEDPLWWAEVDRSYDKLLECCPQTDKLLLEIIKTKSKDFTQFWNVVEKVGRNANLRASLRRWVLERKPSVFTRHLLSRWWNDLDIAERFVAVVVHGVLKESVPRSWLVLYPDREELLKMNVPELIPLLWKNLTLFQKKKVLKRWPGLYYLIRREDPCTRLLLSWYLAKRKVEFLPLTMNELRTNPCRLYAREIEEAVKKRYPRLLRKLSSIGLGITKGQTVEHKAKEEPNNRHG
jgi:hypothetical protein